MCFALVPKSPKSLNLLLIIIIIIFFFEVFLLGWGWVQESDNFALTILSNWFSLSFQWRTKFRKAMNKADNDASTRAIDSLINYEVRL
jgi:ABC-type transport system involved in Fe-S cluster assembly fused permease/ATPase subunit